MKVSIPGFINYKKPTWSDDTGFHFHQSDMSEYGYVIVKAHILEVEIPDDFDPRPKQVELLQAEKQKAMAEFQARVTAIDKQISQLTALEFTA